VVSVTSKTLVSTVYSGFWLANATLSAHLYLAARQLRVDRHAAQAADLGGEIHRAGPRLGPLDWKVKFTGLTQTLGQL
jgi:hypothetical protein